MGGTATFLLAQQPMSPEKPRALVVDDDEPIRAMLGRIVEHQGFTVDMARDGAEAIERLSHDGYNVVLLDLMMPRVDGYGVLSWMRAEKPDLIDCTIVASAVPEREISRQLTDSVYKVHQKPFDMAQLLDDVRRCAKKDGKG
jgi:CheY-like chemotaxis protein